MFCRAAWIAVLRMFRYPILLSKHRGNELIMLVVGFRFRVSRVKDPPLHGVAKSG